MERLQLGHAAEDLALAYLSLKGFRLLARHFRAGKAEVDLVMQDGPGVVLVEVKYRGPGSAGRGAEAVGQAQRLRLERAASAWVARRGLCDVRFDAVLLDEDAEGLTLRHVRGAFSASGRLAF
ncbi:MAG TPA: YraN family protein [Candidatus Saccharimonadales bacterium]|nr:YraN family protein [Candidatus Saccharimonadales bacterium]